MPRKRDGIIQESLKELRQLENEYRGKPEGARITMLRVLKEEPERQIEEVAAMVGYSVSAVKRWLKAYREGGAEALMRRRGGGRDDAKIDVGLSRLTQKLLAGEFNGLGDAEEWIREYRQSLGSQGFAQHLVSAGRNNHDKQRSSKKEEEVDGGMPGLNELVKFFDTVTLTSDPHVWAVSLRRAFHELLGDVDHISISVNINCDILEPSNTKVYVAFDQDLATRDRGVAVATEASGGDEAFHAARVLDSLRRRKFPFDTYRPPRHYVYYYGGEEYLGIIILWRDRRRPPISRRTIETMERLKPLIIFLLSDIVARRQVDSPIDFVFTRVIEELTKIVDLTNQERRILQMQLLGSSYDEIASTLNISLNTVRTHVKSIYTKAGAHGQADFFAKYFTPWLRESRHRN